MIIKDGNWVLLGQRLKLNLLINYAGNSNKEVNNVEAPNRLLEQCNDIESNPGPFGRNLKSGTKKQKTEEKLPPRCQEVDELKVVVDKQAELIDLQKVEIQNLKKKVEEGERKTNDFSFELSEIRKNFHQVQGDVRSNNDTALLSKVETLIGAYNDIQDRLYEIDKSWRNNLIFYGIPADSQDEDMASTEDKVKMIIRRKLCISRDIPMNRVARIRHGPEFRGHKPVQVYFANYNDKEDILRKSKLLKGGNIHISEDFSRKVREQRQELIKFMKEIRSRDPARKMMLRYDKLYMGRDVYFFNDGTQKVEKLHHHIDTGIGANSGFTELVAEEVTKNAQEVLYQRRPMSKIGSRSRTHTPVLSRQNSSMEDMHQVEDFYGTPQPTPLTRRRPTTSRNRNLSNSLSTDSLHLTPSKIRDYERKFRLNRQFTSDTEVSSPTKMRQNREPLFSSDEDVDFGPGLPQSPKKSSMSPSKTSPFPKLAVPRSAQKERKSVVFKSKGSSEEDDEILSLDLNSEKKEKEDSKTENGKAKGLQSQKNSPTEQPSNKSLMNGHVKPPTTTMVKPAATTNTTTTANDNITSEAKTISKEIHGEKSSENASTPPPPKPVILSETSTELVPLNTRPNNKDHHLVPYSKGEITGYNHQMRYHEPAKLMGGQMPALGYNNNNGYNTNNVITNVVNSSGKMPYSFSSHFASSNHTNHRSNAVRTNGNHHPRECNMDDSQRGVLKLNVAIAGEFSMGSFKDK